MEIQPIRVPTNLIRTLPPPVVDRTPVPVVRELQVPVVDVPTPVIEYPTLDAPTQTQYEQDATPPAPQVEQPPLPQELEETESKNDEESNGSDEKPNDRSDTPSPGSTPSAPIIVQVPAVGPVEFPPVAPLVTAGATAVATTTVVLMSNIVLGQVKQVLDAPLKRMLEPKRQKVKLKQKKPVLHYVLNEGQVNVFEYSAKGTRLITTTDKPEQYIRDQVELSSVYEYDNVILINDDIKDMFTKEGQKRFKKLFCPAKKIVKKLSAKISF